MFRFHCKRLLVLQSRRKNGGDSTIRFHFLQNPQSSSSSFVIFKFLSTSSNPNSNSFVVTYLMNSCGLSSEQAVSASKAVRFRNSVKPDSVLNLLKNNGFSEPYITKLITKRPEVLLANHHKTLKPKFDFFNSIGLSGEDLAKIISTDSTILTKSLQKHIIPSYLFLKSIVQTNVNIISILKRSTWVFLRDPEKQMAPNISILRDHGVPESNITTLLLTQPRAFLQNSDRFKEIIEEIKGIGLEPSKFSFSLAIHGLTSMSKSSWDSKFNVYRSWGWSEDEIRMAFRKQPCCMMVSEKKIMKVMDFLVNQMGYNPSLMAKHPTVLNLSLEKRIIPRGSVFQVLVSKGLVPKDRLITTALTTTEESFVRRYVTNYEEEVPDLLNVYRGKLHRLELQTSFEGVGCLKML